MANPKTGHKTFDSQFDLVTTGAVISNVQRSEFIRPFNLTTNPAGNPSKPGELQRFDLECFVNLPPGLKRAMKEFAKDETAMLYKFRHWECGEEVTHGWVITKLNGNLLMTLYTRNTPKSHAVVDTCAKLVTTEETNTKGDD